MKITRFYILSLILAMAGLIQAQQDTRHIRQGNRYYDDGEYKKAEIEYIKSTESSRTPHKGIYNLGNALYMQDNYTQAAAAYDTLRTFRMDDQTRSGTYYNLGNSLLKVAIDSAHLAGQLLPQSIEAYKNSLRINPEDADAKYNLAFAQRLLKKTQQQQQQQQQQQNQDKNEDQKQDQNEDQKQDQQQQEQDRRQNEEMADQSSQQQGQPQQISKEDAERILEALKNDEKETLENLMQAQIKSTRVVKSEKDW
jgi:Mg-chelatase subunit ChlI